MVAITKDEKNAIVERYPNVHIVRTMNGDSKRHHYYCTEENGVMRFLDNYRRKNVVEEHPQCDQKNGNNKYGYRKRR